MVIINRLINFNYYCPGDLRRAPPAPLRHLPCLHGGTESETFLCLLRHRLVSWGVSGVMLQEFRKPGKFRNSGIMLQNFRVFRNYQIKLDKKIIKHNNKNKLGYCDTAWWVQETLMIINYVCEISLKTGNIWMYKYFLHFLQFTYDSA